MKTSQRNGPAIGFGWIYALTMLAFAVVSAVLMYAGYQFHTESAAIQKQIKTLSEQQVLSRQFKSLATEYWYADANSEYLDDQMHEGTRQMKSILSRLDMLSESKRLKGFYSQDMKSYLEQLKATWQRTSYELGHIPEARTALELQRLQNSCDQLLRSGAYLMHETLAAQSANQTKRTCLMYIFAGSLVLLGVIMMWSLWVASNNRMEVLALNQQLERRVAERTAQLEKTNMYLANVQSSICSALVVVDVRGRITSWNPAAESMWGVHKAQAVGQDVLSLLPLEDLEKFEAAFDKVRQTSQTQMLRELEMRDGSGQRRCGNASLVPMLGPLAELRGVVILIDDVTEVALARRELAANAQEIADTNKTLQRVNGDMEQFVYAASHDLRSPLVNMHSLTRKLGKCYEEVRSAVNGNGNGRDQLKDAGVSGVLGHDIPKLIFRMNRTIGKFGSIIDGLLRFSRTGREEYHKTNIDMAQEVAKAVDLFAGAIEEQDVQLYVGELPPAYGDREAINKVLANLIGNALNYLDPDRDGEILVEGKKLEGGMCMYSIQDNGVGIKEGDLERVFQIFERLNSSQTEGEGLGLTIVKKIVERHGGDISVESQWGEGTTFWFTLEASQEQLEQVAG